MGRTNFKSGKKKGKGKKPVKWNATRIQQAYDFSLLGLTEIEMAQVMDVTIGTIQYWRINKPGFKEALHEGRKIASAKVVNKLFQRACGYSHPDTHFVNDRVREFDAEGNVIREYTNVIQIPIIKHYPPETAAGKFFLGVKERQLWNESTNININQNLNINKKIDLSDCSKEELQLMKNIGMKQLVQDIPNENVSSN